MLYENPDLGWILGSTMVQCYIVTELRELIRVNRRALRKLACWEKADLVNSVGPHRLMLSAHGVDDPQAQLQLVVHHEPKASLRLTTTASELLWLAEKVLK